MGGETKEFRVDPDELKLVAEAISDLLERVKGDTGEYGSSQDFQQNASSADLISGMGNLDGGAGGSGAFGGAYAEIFTATNTTYQQMVTNLTNLEAACRSTAEQYKDQEDQTEQDINQTNPDGE